MENEAAPKKSLIPALEDQLNIYLVQKAPFQLPEGARSFIVTIAPWLTLVLLLLTLPIIFAALGLATVFAPITYYDTTSGISTTLGLILALVELGLYAVALPGLFKKSKSGWNFVFYASLLSIVGNVINFSIFGLVIGTLISLYVLFQIRSRYH